MGFKSGNTYSKGRPKGSTNKANNEIVTKLDDLVDGLINTIDIEELSQSQKIKMLQVILQYRLPKLTSIDTNQEQAELPLFDQIQIVTSVDEKERLETVEAYEKEHGVKIL
tara:strand:+ start:856 stop:1188 length:333 start_codon:yes stop_codon:yes gene_type:complete